MKGLEFPLCAVNFWVEHGVHTGCQALCTEENGGFEGPVKGAEECLATIYIPKGPSTQ